MNGLINWLLKLNMKQILKSVRKFKNNAIRLNLHTTDFYKEYLKALENESRIDS